MLRASMSMPCSSIARIRSAAFDMSKVWGSTLRPIRAIASGTAQCACTSMVLTRRPFTTTSRRRPCAWADAIPVMLQATNAMPAAPSTNSRRVLIVPSLRAQGITRVSEERAVRFEPEHGATDRLVVHELQLIVARHHLGVARVPLERARGEDRGGAGGSADHVGRRRRALRRVGHGQPEIGALALGDRPRGDRGLPHLADHVEEKRAP